MGDFPAIARRPWIKAFVMFCHGSPLEDISASLDIPLHNLKQRASMEQWVQNRANLPIAVQTSVNNVVGEMMVSPNGKPVESEVSIGQARLQAILENRNENLKAFQKLRDYAIKQIDAIAEGKLKVQKVFCFKGMVVTHDAAPGPGDWVNIATFLQTISQGTYRALGDFQGPEKGQDAAAGALTPPTAPAITIILPRAISTPREEREVIDLQHVTVESK